MTLREDGSWDVATNQGTIRAKRVVNACGEMIVTSTNTEYLNLNGITS